MKNLLILTGLLTCLLTLSACGYSFQNSRSPLADKEGIRKIYVSPLINNSYKAGIENVVYNALLRSLQSHGRVTLVRNKADADAVLVGTIDSAIANGTTSVLANILSAPAGVIGNSSIQVFSEYNAVLTCSFTLNRNGDIPRGKKPTVWSAGFSRAKLYPATDQLGVYGNTNALINESSFDRALSEIATAMMDDVNESMLAMF